MASVRVLNHILHRRPTIASGKPNTYGLYCMNVTSNNARQSALYSTKKTLVRVNSIEAENKVQVGFAEVVKENIKSGGYLGVIIGGVGVTAFMFYAIFNELLSSNSPNGVYSKAFNRCVKHPQVCDALGEPIKGYGEETRRGRRNHVSHNTFIKNGVKHMRMKFYIQGIRTRGTVSLEVQENKSGNFEYRYFYVTIDNAMRSIIKIEDNRDKEIEYNTSPEVQLI